MNIKNEWLVRHKTPEEFEREALERKASSFNISLKKVVQQLGERPFGNMTEKWNEFIARMQNGDEFWFFNTPRQTFVKGMGCNGYAILRNGEVVETPAMLRT